MAGISDGTSNTVLLAEVAVVVLHEIFSVVLHKTCKRGIQQAAWLASVW